MVRLVDELVGHRVGGALDAITTTYERKGKTVEITGLNQASAERHGRLTGELTSHWDFTGSGGGRDRRHAWAFCVRSCTDLESRRVLARHCDQPNPVTRAVGVRLTRSGEPGSFQ